VDGVPVFVGVSVGLSAGDGTASLRTASPCPEHAVRATSEATSMDLIFMDFLSVVAPDQPAADVLTALGDAVAAPAGDLGDRGA
jgi:hypothetical protein